MFFLEKPIALELAEADELIALAASRKLALASYNRSRCIDNGGYLGSFNAASTAEFTNPYNTNPTRRSVVLIRPMFSCPSTATALWKAGSSPSSGRLTAAYP
jgi:hypothetical protein